ncbi:hypothetical protein [Saccharibacillus sp. JS10]|uniref:hypothetical protein n=1 Tax=Saccharibacillus sp. JS10 TaxID=2950552 RepID=UPI002108DECA|nr:hypothetical protein [Saccharibacillus sp. JS10]MCQ4087488.1 hypothetical protein [Saccharibacillus sp. JS10]
MKSKSSFWIFVLCFVMLLPNVAGATEFKESPSDEVFSNSSEGRVVTPEEFKLISDTVIAEQEKDPSITVEEVIEQLGLKKSKYWFRKSYKNSLSI